MKINFTNPAHAYLIVGSINHERIARDFKSSLPDCFKINDNPIKISHIREFQRWIYLKPHSSQFKLAFLTEVDTMTLEAANALLKILEEPPPSAILFLQTCKKKAILPTILSRCQIIRTEIPEEITPEDYFSLDQIKEMSFKERFDYAGKISKSEKILPYLNLWEKEFRTDLISGNGHAKEKIQAIFQTKGLLSTNSSIKLLLENLLINF